MQEAAGIPSQGFRPFLWGADFACSDGAIRRRRLLEGLVNLMGQTRNLPHHRLHQVFRRFGPRDDLPGVQPSTIHFLEQTVARLGHGLPLGVNARRFLDDFLHR